MTELYTNEKLSALNSQLNRRWLVLAAVSAACLGVLTWTMLVWGNWHELENTFPLSSDALKAVSIAAAIVGGFFAVFWIEMFCRPLLQHRKLMRSAMTGRTHTRSMEFVRAESGSSLVEGVSCRSLIFLGDPDKHGTRDQLFYWDEEIPLPDLQAGTVYELKYTGKNIIAISA